MRFNSKAYDKVFPRQTDVEQVETSVETFRPSQDEDENVVTEKPEKEESEKEERITDPLLDEDMGE